MEGTVMSNKQHWENIYSTKDANSVSWFQPHADLSLKMIQDTIVPYDAGVIDVGGGASTLVDDLLQQGYSNLTVLDLSAAALALTQTRLGERAQQVNWIDANITEVSLPTQAYQLWHDRAVFHFLTTHDDRRAYIDVMSRALTKNAHVIISTFAEDGATKCSGLDVVRYSVASLQHELGALFTLVHSEEEFHPTPFGTTQKFIYCHFRFNK
jgi:2-polyprenyl-3-methyl-5-hydroxy-6-metoxy-1,4-benzoquinol methylase